MTKETEIIEEKEKVKDLTEEDSNAILSNEEKGSNIRRESEGSAENKGSKEKKQGMEKTGDSGGSPKVGRTVRELSKDLKEKAIVEKIVKCEIRGKDGKITEKKLTISKIFYGDIVDIAPNLATLVNSFSSKGITFETFGLSPSLSSIVLLNALPELTTIIATLVHATVEELRNMEVTHILNLAAAIWDLNKELIIELFSTFQISAAQKPSDIEG